MSQCGDMSRWGQVRPCSPLLHPVTASIHSTVPYSWGHVKASPSCSQTVLRALSSPCSTRCAAGTAQGRRQQSQGADRVGCDSAALSGSIFVTKGEQGLPMVLLPLSLTSRTARAKGQLQHQNPAQAVPQTQGTVEVLLRVLWIADTPSSLRARQAEGRVVCNGSCPRLCQPQPRKRSKPAQCLP